MKIRVRIVTNIKVTFEEESGYEKLIPHPFTGHLVWTPF